MKQESSNHRADDANDDVKNDTLLSVSPHDQARKPANNSADNQPDDDSANIHRFPPVSPAALHSAPVPAPQTRDAPRLFRIRKGLSRSWVKLLPGPLPHPARGRSIALLALVLVAVMLDSGNSQARHA